MEQQIIIACAVALAVVVFLAILGLVYAARQPLSGYFMVIASGPMAGETRRIVSHGAGTFTVDRPWPRPVEQPR